MTIPEQAVQAAKDVLYYANPNDVERALTAALPFLPVQGAVKKLEDVLRELITDQSEGEWDESTIEKDVRTFSARILSALEPSVARSQALEEAFKAGAEWCNPRRNQLVLYTTVEKAAKAYALSLSSPDHADAGKVEGDGWLPIETAPKDGTPVLAYQAGRYFKCWLECDRYEGGYFWQDEEDSEPSPTHWRPLPSAPSGGDRYGE
ncbi:uncharacterized protein DUF551 [Ochrobactrum sp. J50]|uniref:DUF551 domain-containing protein n=1 Tax=Ochrobactrum sp. J50 TaxID=936132 RepID=UPI0011A64FAB|nr:DUF551 domain-containing protein [Ochrobactrum sp. J50]TWH01770.1 uncharacterized protein DUF551 [Ochrobactrum sp. J50]